MGALGLAVYTQLEGLIWRLNKGTEDREDLYGEYWPQIEAAPPAEWCFGHGSSAGKRINMTRAHNDWLEMWFDYGLIGALITGMVFVSLGICSASSLLRREHAASASCFSFVVIILMSIYAAAFASPNTVLHFCVCGMAHGGFDAEDTLLSLRAKGC